MKLLYLFIILSCLPFLGICQEESRGVAVLRSNKTSNEGIGYNYDNKYALIIGINDYLDNKIPDLKYAVNDAIEISKILVNNLNFDANKITVLLDSNATRSNILTTLQNFINNTDISSNSQLIVYFAGHGSVSKSGKSGFLLGFDTKEGNELATAIAMDEIARIANECISKHVLFLIDACYGGFANSRTAATSALLKNTWTQKARHIITAGDSNEEVLEASEWQHSAFTKVFMDAIQKKEADVNGDNILTSSELFLYLEQRISFYASQKGGKQTPQFGKLSPDNGLFFLELEPLSIAKLTDDLVMSEDKEILDKLNSKIRIYSNVTSARVFVNAIEVGFLNANNYELKLKPGFHKIELKLDKYENGIFEGLISPDSSYTIPINLTKKVSNVRFNISPNDAAVLLNNNLIGIGSFSAEIPKGRHEVMIEKKGFRPEKSIINVIMDSTTFNYKIYKITSKIELKSTPSNALITSSNDTLGYTPLTLDLDFGQHNLTFSKKNFSPNQLILNINDSEIKQYDIYLKESTEYQISKIARNTRTKKSIGFLINGSLAFASYKLYNHLDNKLTTLDPNDPNFDNYKIAKYGAIGFTGIFSISAVSNLIKAFSVNKSKLYRKKVKENLDIRAFINENKVNGISLSYKF